MQKPKAKSQNALIVNADDFGLSPGVNAGILEAFRAGVVRGASLMVNTPFAEAAARQAAQAGLELGVHLNLTTGRPVSPPERVRSLVGADGRFHVLGGLLLRLSAGRVGPDHLQRELEAQVERARALGVRPSHLDGHHHIQVHPAVGRVVLRLAVDNRLGLRCPVEPPRHGNVRDRIRALLLLGPAAWLRGAARAGGVPTTHHFRGISLGYGFDASALVDTIRRLPGGLTELMCHPGYPDPELAAATRYTVGRERELTALADDQVLGLLRERGIALVRWSEACEA